MSDQPTSSSIPDVQTQIAAALSAHRAGHLDDAEAIYRRVLAADRENADALHLLGVLLGERGDHADAVALIRQAIAASPQASLFHNSLGNALREAGQLDLSIAAYQQALRLNAGAGEPWSNLGNALRVAGRLDESLHAHQQATRLLPICAEAQNNLGITHRQRGETPAAIAAFEKAITLRPDYPQALNNLGSARRAVGDVDAALAALLRAARLQRDSAEIFSNLGNVLKDKGRLDESLAAQLHAIELNPHYASAHANLAIALFETGRLDQSLQSHANAIALMPHEPQLASNRLYTLLFHPTISPEQLRVEHESWAQKFAVPFATSAPRRRAAAGSPPAKGKPAGKLPLKGKLRLGYVSPDFRLHPVGRFLLPLFSHRNRHQFELFVYSGVLRPDAITATLQKHCDHWIRTVGMPDADLADKIRADRIDILVDLTQHMADSRLLVFARRPAPLQITYLGTLATTGLSAFDYRLSDSHLDPLGESDDHYTEKTHRLPGSYWCYPAPPEAPAVKPLSPGPITFGCLNNFSKLSDPCLHLWATILAASGDSHLLLHAHPGVHRQRVLDIFAAQNVAPDRIAFAPLASMNDYFVTYQRIAIALDPFPYAGGTTTCDALWMGVPVVTLRGATAPARAGVSILHALGHPNWIADSPQQYIEIATGLAADPPRLTDVRRNLRQQMLASSLCDALRFVAEMEQAFRAMWKSVHC
jgi:predicted O-linked N-acetylglucosamine transferase (SPINDLY family)